MSAARKMIQRGPLIAACTMLVSAVIAGRANAAEPTESAMARTDSPACKAARQQAWFERQLRVTDGDASPVQPAEPAACMPTAVVRGEPGRAPGAAASDPSKARR